MYNTGQAYLEHLIAAVAHTSDSILRSKKERERQRLSGNDQGTQTLHKVRVGNPSRRA